jgi:hypothetical protein
MGKKMTNRYKIMLKIALVGVALAASGCSLGTAELVDDLPPGLATAFGNAGADRDGDYGNRGGNLPGGGNQANSGNTGGGDVGTTGGEDPETGPGNSDFGRGGHANAGGGNDGEFDGKGDEMDPGQSADSNGASGGQD